MLLKKHLREGSHPVSQALRLFRYVPIWAFKLAAKILPYFSKTAKYYRIEIAENIRRWTPEISEQELNRKSELFLKEYVLSSLELLKTSSMTLQEKNDLISSETFISREGHILADTKLQQWIDNSTQRPVIVYGHHGPGIDLMMSVTSRLAQARNGLALAPVAQRKIGTKLGNLLMVERVSKADSNVVGISNLLPGLKRMHTHMRNNGAMVCFADVNTQAASSLPGYLFGKRRLYPKTWYTIHKKYKPLALLCCVTREKYLQSYHLTYTELDDEALCASEESYVQVLEHMQLMNLDRVQEQYWQLGKGVFKHKDPSWGPDE